VRCLGLRYSWRAPPLGLLVVLLGLHLLREGLWIVMGVVFVACAWFGWMFERWLGLALRLLGMNLWPEATF
jgi:hypothetical protein